MRERKPIDEALRRFLDEAAAAPLPPVPTSDVERARIGRALMLGALEKRTSIPGLPNGVVTRDLALPDVPPIRLYTPLTAEGPLPVLLYLHGGGWVVGSTQTHDPFCRLLSEASGIMIASVEYRLAPEYPYPAALDDTMAAVQWALHSIDGWRGCGSVGFGGRQRRSEPGGGCG